jgi:chromosome segregation ATPase
MVFTSAEEAKPKKPHPEGLACLGCGATEASQWRGPGGQYCSCCKKAAAGARAAEKADPRDALLQELRQRLEATEAGLAKALARLDEQERWREETNAFLDDLDGDLSKDAEDIRTVKSQLASLSQRLLLKRRPSDAAASAAKRPALALATSAQSNALGTA